MASALPSGSSCKDPVVVPAFGTWRKDSECSSVAEDSSIPDPSLEGLSYAFQQARLARVVSRKEESAERPVLTAEAPKVVPAFGTWHKDEDHRAAGSNAAPREEEGLGSSSLEGLSYAFQQARLAKVVARKSMVPRGSRGSSREVESSPRAEASPTNQGTPRFGDWDKGGEALQGGLGDDPTFSDDFAHLLAAKKNSMAWGKKVLISPYRPDDLLSPASSTVSTYRRDTDNSKDANRLAAYPSDGAEPPFQGGAEPWSTAEASFAASDEGAEARPPSPASPDETSSARGSPFQQQWHEHLAGGTSHEGSVASTPLRGPWKDFVSSSAASEVSSVLSTDARSSMIGAAGPALLPGQLPGPVPPYTSSSSPLAKEASQPLPEGPLGTPPREEASRDFEEQTGSATPRDPTNGSHSPMAGGASLQADSGRMSEGQVPATVDGDGGSRWGQGGASPEPVPAQAPEPQGTGPGKPLKSRAGAGQDKLLYGNTAAALANSSSPWEAAILQQKLAVRIAARKAEKSAAAGTPPVRRPAMLAELDRAMAEARKGLIQAREGSTGAGEEGEHAEGALTPGGRSRDTKAQEEVLSDQATPSRGSLGDASPGAHRGADASQSPSPRQDKAGNGEFRSPSLPGTGERREPLDIPLRKSSSVDNPSSAKKRITFGQGAPPRRRLVRSVTEGASAKGRNKEGDPGLSAGHGSGGSSSALASVAEEDGGLTGNAVRRSSSNASPGPRLMGMALQRSASAAPGKVGSSSGRRGGAAMERIESNKHNRNTSLESPTPLLSSLEPSGSMRRHLFSGLGGGEPRSAAPPVVDLSARGRVMMAAGIPPSATAHSSGAPESPLRLPSIPGSPLLRAKSAMHSPLPRGKSAPAGAGQEAAGSPPRSRSPGAGCLLPSKSSKGSASQRTPRAASSKGTVKGPSLPEASSTASQPVKGPVKGPAKGGLPRGSRDGAIPERSLSVPARAAQRKTKEKKVMNEGNGELPRLCSEASEGSGSSDSMGSQETGRRGRGRKLRGNCLVQ